MNTPDLTQKVIGFRQWYIRDEELHSVGGFSHVPWKMGPQRAICLRKRRVGGIHMLDPCIPVVNAHCHCGFYALHRLSEAHWAGDSIRGIVLGWGRMAIHDSGWRAQFVELAALIYPPGESLEVSNEQVDLLAKKYKVPTISWNEAEAYAKEFGDYVPDSLKPLYWTEEDKVRYVREAERYREAQRVIQNLQEGLREEEFASKSVLDMISEALIILNPNIPEAYAALHNIYVPTAGELLEGLVNGIVVDYVPEPEKPKPSEIKVDRGFELSISTNATVLWLPTHQSR